MKRRGPNTLPSRPPPLPARLPRAVAGLAIHGVHAATATDPGTDSVITDWLYCSLFALAALSCLLRAVRERRGGGAALPW